MPGLLTQKDLDPFSTTAMGAGPSPGAQITSGKTAGVATGPTPNDPNATLSKQNPLPGQNYLPSNFSDIYNAHLAHTPDYYGGMLNKGIDTPAVPFSGGTSGQAGSSDPMVQAIQNNAAKSYGDVATGIKNQNNMTAQGMASQDQATAAKYMGAEYQNDVQNFNAQYQYQIQRQTLLNEYAAAWNSAANQVTGQVLGGLGQVVAAIAGGA